MEKFNFKVCITSIVIILCVIFKYLIDYEVEMTYLYLFLLFLLGVELIYVIAKKTFNKKQMILVLVFSAISIIYVIAYKDVNLLISFLLSLTITNGDIKKFLKVFLAISVFMYVLTVSMSILGIIDDYKMIRNTTYGVLPRHSLGFNHPNEMFLYFMPIALASYYLYSDRKWYFPVLAILTGILYVISYSRTGALAIVALVIFHLLSKKFKLKKLVKILPIVLVLLTFLLIIVSGNNQEDAANYFLSRRPYFWNKFMHESNGLALFGSTAYESTFVDNFYMFIIFGLGIYGIIVYSFIFYKGSKNIIDKKLLVVILTFTLYGFTETNTIIGSINFTLAIFIYNIIYSVKDIEKSEVEKLDES